MTHLLPQTKRLLILLTLFFGISVGYASSPISRITQLAEAHPGLSGVSVLEKGEHALLSRAWLTEHATRSIDVQYFIWSSDNIGILSSEALLRAAKRGVQIRIIVDDLLIDAEPETLLSLAAHPNVHIRIYNPLHSVGVSVLERLWHLITSFRSFNQRMHDKSAIFDGKFAITGGRNMADEYFDYDHEYNFRDRDVLVTGTVVKPMADSFQRFWNHPLSVPIEELLSDEKESLTSLQPEKHWDWLHSYAKDRSNFAPEVRRTLEKMEQEFPMMVEKMSWVTVDFINDLPGKNSQENGLGGGGNTTSDLIELVKNAKRQITIQSPYLVMPEGGLDLFSELIQRGVQVRIVTNSLASTDNLQAFSGYHKQRQSLLEAGIDIYEFKPDAAITKQLITRSTPLPEKLPTFALHAKSMVVDGKIAYIGTFNLDPRSANLNTEVGVLIHDEQLAQTVEATIEEDMKPENSWRPRTEDSDASAGLFKYLQLRFWRLLPLEPLL